MADLAPWETPEPSTSTDVAPWESPASNNRAESAAESVLGDVGASPGVAQDIVGGAELAGAGVANTVGGLANIIDYGLQRAGGATPQQAAAKPLVPGVSVGPAGQAVESQVESLPGLNVGERDQAGVYHTTPTTIGGDIAQAKETAGTALRRFNAAHPNVAYYEPDIANAANFAALRGVLHALPGGEAPLPADLPAGVRDVLPPAASRPVSAEDVLSDKPIGATPAQAAITEPPGAAARGPATGTPPPGAPRRQPVPGKPHITLKAAAPAPEPPAAAPAPAAAEPAATAIPQLFKHPGNENARIIERTPLEQQQLVNDMHAVGITEAPASVLNGDRLEMANDSRTARASETGAGKRMSTMLSNARSSIRNYFSNMREQLGGGVVGDSQSAEEEVGRNLVAPISQFEQALDNHTQGLYEGAKRQTAGMPPAPMRSLQAALGQNSAFVGTPEGTHLLAGIRARMGELGIQTLPDGSIHATPEQAERLRQYVTQNYNYKAAGASRLVKNALDEDVTSRLGGQPFEEGRRIRAIKGAMLEEQPVTAKLMDPEDRAGIDRAVRLSAVSDHLMNQDSPQLGHYISTVRTAAKMYPRIAPAAARAINELRTRYLDRMVRLGDSNASKWNAKAVGNFLRDHDANLRLLFNPDELDQIRAGHDVGHAFNMPDTYEGAAAQTMNFMTRHSEKVAGGVNALAGAAGAHLAGPIGAAAADMAAGPVIKGTQSLIERTFGRAMADKRILNVEDLHGKVNGLSGKFPGQRGGPRMIDFNGSAPGASGANSVEAMNRNAQEAAAGQDRYEVDPDGNVTPIPRNADAVDRKAPPGHLIVQRGVGENANGWTILDRGGLPQTHANGLMTRAVSTGKLPRRDLAARFPGQRGGPKFEPARPPLRQGYDPAAGLLDQQVQRDVEAAHANPGGERPPLRQGEDSAQALYDQQARSDANRPHAVGGPRTLSGKFPGQRGGPKFERQAEATKGGGKTGEYEASPALNRFIRSRAPAHVVDPNGPATWDELQDRAHESPMPINPQEAEGSIYKDTPTNIAFRAWHDSLHLKHNGGFDHEGELKTALAHQEEAKAAGLSQQDRAALWADTWKTFEHHEKTGEFPKNPRKFVYQQLAADKPQSQLNIGLHVGNPDEGGHFVEPDDAVKKLRQMGYKVGKTSIVQSDTEPTLVADIHGAPVTHTDLRDLSAQLQQSAIAQRIGDRDGMMAVAPGHEETAAREGWDTYNPAYFRMHSGKTALEEGIHPNSTVTNAQRSAFPGIYDKPADILSRVKVAEEDPIMHQLFGVTRKDLHDVAMSRESNTKYDIPGAKKKARGSGAAAGVMNDRNAQRLVDIINEAKRNPALFHGMVGWYVMDPLYKKVADIVGEQAAPAAYSRLNHFMGMASPGSDVETEINRGTAAHMMATQGKFDKFLRYGGRPEGARGKPKELAAVRGHPYHSTAQGTPMREYLENGELQMKSPKVPTYIKASEVPETGFQNHLLVGDSHWSRGVGLSDTRTAKIAGSVTTPEIQQLHPWYREKVAKATGLPATSAQAVQWGALSHETGVETPVGAPKLELFAQQVRKAAARLKITPEEALKRIILGTAHAG